MEVVSHDAMPYEGSNVVLRNVSDCWFQILWVQIARMMRLDYMDCFSWILWCKFSIWIPTGVTFSNSELFYGEWFFIVIFSMGLGWPYTHLALDALDTPNVWPFYNGTLVLLTSYRVIDVWVVCHKILDQRGWGGCLSNVGTNKGLKDRRISS